MTEDEDIDFAELMSEPPGGENHGWRRAEGGGWTSLGIDSRKLPPTLPIPSDHGTLTKYASRGCRCDLCRAAGREWKRKRRAELRDV